MVFANAVLAAATFAMAVAVAIQVWRMGDQIEVARDAIVAAEHSAQMQERPWVLFDPSGEHDATDTGLVVFLRNFGNSPAFQVSWSLQLQDQKTGRIECGRRLFMVTAPAPGRPILPPREPLRLDFPPDAMIGMNFLLKVGWRDQHGVDAYSETCLLVAPNATVRELRVNNCWECNEAAYHQVDDSGEVIMEPRLLNLPEPDPGPTADAP